MTCAVNLLPESCHAARRRVVRRNTWSVVIACAGLTVFGTWVALRATDRSTNRLRREYASVQAKQSELDRQLTLATRLRNELAQRARALTSLRQDQALPRQLLVLTQDAPEGVVLTEIQSLVKAGERSMIPRPTAPPRPALEAMAAMTPAQPLSGQRVPDNPVIQMSGYAVNHDELTRLIEALQRIEQWEHVELLRATRQPYLEGLALAFRLECRSAETSR